MKTAMQKLIEWIDSELKLAGYEHIEIMDKATELLEKEKQQLIEAYNDGLRTQAVGLNSEINRVSEQYYSDKFKTD